MASKLNMIEGTLCIGLITKNIANYLPKTLKTVSEYTSLFTDYRVVMVDGYSTDATKIIASSWCKADPERREFILQPTQGLQRMPSICEARNQVLSHFSPLFGEGVYLLLLDADSPNAVPFEVDGFLSAFTPERINIWDAIFPNQRKEYYDLYALRDEQLSENYQLRYRHLNWQDGSMQRALLKYQSPKQDSTGLYPVKSAFGGAGLYKTTNIKGVTYGYKEQWVYNGQTYVIDSCEHVILHQQLVEKGCKLYINCNWYIGEHV